MSLLSFVVYSQAPIVEFGSYYDSYWGEWHGGDNYKAKGTYNDFVAYWYINHPSEYYFKLTFNVPNAINGEVPKKERKRRLKNNQWYEYEGTIEFYLNDNISTVKQWVMNFGKIGRGYPYRNIGNNIRIEYPCKIRIAPYKDNPRTYNIFFDKFGIAFIINSGKE